MSREHLYKAKRVNWRELPKEEWWVEGCLLIDYVSGQYFIHVNGNSVNESDKVNEEGCLKFFAYEVEKETVCEYTGLTDKNGGNIFENNILSFSQKGQIANGVVKMVDGCFFAIIEGQKCWLSEGVKRYKGKIIGNIFDNPELLEGGKSE